MNRLEYTPLSDPGASANGSNHQPTTPMFNDAGVDAHAKLAAMADGDQTGQLDASVRAAVRASEEGERDGLESALNAIASERVGHTRKLKKVGEELERVDPQRIVHGKRRSMGFAAWVALVAGAMMLGGFIYVEQFGAGLALTDTGAFAVDSIWKGMLITATAVTVGLAFAKGYSKMPPRWRRRAFGFACFALLALFAVYLTGFTLGAKDASEQNTAAFNILSGGNDGSESATPAGGGLGAWLMFFGLLGMLPLTTFIGSVSIQSYIASFETQELNPDYVRLETQQNLHGAELLRLDEKKAALLQKLASFVNEENRKVQFAMLRYLGWKAHLGGRGDAPPALMAMIAAALLSMLVTGCDRSSSGKNSAIERMGGGSSPTDKRSEVIQQVIAASPRLDDAMKAQVAALLEEDAGWLATTAPEGSSTIILDALEGKPVTDLRAAKGVTKIRRRALMEPLRAVQKFLSKPLRREDQDAQMHIPRIAEVLGQGRLKPGTHVILLGDPLFRSEKGADAYYSMRERYPSDGFLFEQPQLSIFSTLGREKRLDGLLIHIGYPSDDIFVDETHRESIRRFYALYFQHQGATLVSFLPSFPGAIQAARDGHSDPILTQVRQTPHGF